MSRRYRVAMISTTIAAIGPMLEEFGRLMPEADVMHFLDEGLVVEFMRSGGLSREARVRTLELARAAEQAGAEIIVCSCSTLSPVFGELEPFIGIPMVSIDQAMAEEACRRGSEIIIAATAESVLQSVLPTFAKAAAAVGRSPEIKTVVLSDARKLPRSSPEFFEVVGRGVSQAAAGSPVVAVAQCSMAGCLPLVDEEVKERVLWGAPYAVRAVKAIAEKLGQ